jgi:hypothetical protein
MNPATKTNIGKPIINKIASTTPPVPTTDPVGRVAGVIFVALAVILAKIGINVLTAAVNGTMIAASKRPIINAYTAITPAIINANGTIGTFLTSSPSSPNFIPPNLGTSIL